MAHPLSIRAEARRQLGRRRTLWSFVLVLALPLVLIGAFAFGSRGGSGTSLVSLATSGSANFALFTTSSAAQFLLIVLTALFVGDAAPSEASWSSLRYLLVAPVPRSRLLTSKLIVGLLTVALAVVVLVAWSVLVGGLAYGWSSFSVPGGGTLDWSVFGWRLVGVALYVIVLMLTVAGIAFFFGVRTDAPLAAVGGAVLVTIISTILGQIENLGSLRNGLPLYYDRAWFDLLSPTVDWTAMRHGALWSVLWFTAFVGLAYAVFRRKDVLS